MTCLHHDLRAVRKFKIQWICKAPQNSICTIVIKKITKMDTHSELDPNIYSIRIK